MTEELIKDYYNDFLDSLLKGDHSDCLRLIQNILKEEVPVIELYEKLLKKALYEIGELWENNKISVGTEHLASAIVEVILNEIYIQVISKEKTNKSIIVACVENEFHQIGIKMISDVFEMNGWDSHFPGANISTKELINYIKILNPDMLAISLSIYSNLPILESMIQKVRKEFPELPILIGGQAFRHGEQNILLKYDNVIYKHDLYSTELFIKNEKDNLKY